MPALDGLRALAVIAVLAYHADLPWARAGFLGVDIFFVISGYLITALLINEHARTGRIRLVEFWKRRARRLLPALLVLLAVVSLAVPVLAPDQNESLKGDLIAALAYVSNWWLVFQDQPYFLAMGRPPLLQHLWSLAVEEQFYLLWPVAVMLALRGPRSKPRHLLKWVLAVMGASALAMAFMYSPEGNVSRVYYGTDTRVGTIMAGVALALIFKPGSRSASPRLWASIARDAAAVGAIAALAWIVVNLNAFEPLLYRGGFTMVALISAVAVAATAVPGRLTQALMGSLPLRWLGQRSYSIYLWHWPVFMVTRPELDTTLTGLPLLALRLSLTLTLAAASYALIEQPVRDGALGRAFYGVRFGLRNRSFGRAAAGLASLTLAMMVAGAVGAGTVISREAPVPPAQAALITALEQQTAVEVPDPVPHDLKVGEVVEADAGAAPGEAAEEPAEGDPVPAPGPASVTAIGDSVMLIAKDALAGRLDNAVVDAAIGRQAAGIIETVQAYAARGELGSHVIVHTGTNGPITLAQFEQLMAILHDVPHVFVVNVKVARPWEEVNNSMLAGNIERFPNASLIDWKAEASARPDMFYRDGVHLRPSGVGVYVELLATRVGG